ncbi:MAG: protein-glutamine glutaminase family protein [Vulcanimicrobiota bacterium]
MNPVNWKSALQSLRRNALIATRVKAQSDADHCVSKDRIAEAYREVSDSVDLVGDRPEDGCYARAQLLCDGLAERGIESEKVFVTPFFKDLESNGAKWRYHVATVAMTTDQGAQVLDPVASEHPIPLEDWFGSIWQGGPGLVSLHEPTKYLNGLTFSRDSQKHTRQARECLKELRGAQTH